jgi:hypothetical protein
MRSVLGAATAAMLLFGAPPALAHDGHARDDDSRRGPHYEGYEPGARNAWLADCRQRLSSHDSGLGGAVIGGVVGGIAGNRIAGRHNRTVGTLAGAAVGAAAGAVIDKAEDAGRNRDECEAYLDDYYADYTRGGYPGGPGPGYGQGQGYGYAYPGGYYPAYAAAPGCCMMQPVMMAPAPRAEQHCTETVEYVTEYVPAPRRRAIPPRRAKVVPDKRTKLVPTK